ncbi:MAG: lactate racemase domain-containing protein [Actinomycetaceae bacterium]|nr:lactate racemase domain-containing protein [Actinomycetaceae bacterium]
MSTVESLYPDLPPAKTLGSAQEVLDWDAIRAFVKDSVGAEDFTGKRITVIVPDGTRHAPVDLMLQALRDALGNKPKDVRVVIAAGTHAAMDENAIAKLTGSAPGDFAGTYPGWQIFNHEWWDEDTFEDLGTIPREKIAELTGGRLTDRDMTVLVNKMVVDTDVSIVIGPVLPHEVVGISGGNKYFFPGLSGHDVIDMSHWVGALITCYEMIGTVGITPVRKMIDAAADLVPSKKYLLGMIVKPGSDDLNLVTFGDTKTSWEACARVSSQVHIKWCDRPYKTIVSIVPEMYEDVWTGAKGFYKLEPVCADGGQIILYAPHITSVADMHPGLLDIGYHNRDYYVKQWDKFKDHPWGELAHSTHVTGLGTYDAASGTETNRITCAFAMSIPREVVEGINKVYVDPASLDFEALEADPDVLVVHNAGELLHRLKDPTQISGDPELYK